VLGLGLGLELRGFGLGLVETDTGIKMQFNYSVYNIIQYIPLMILKGETLYNRVLNFNLYAKCLRCFKSSVQKIVQMLNYVIKRSQVLTIAITKIRETKVNFDIFTVFSNNFNQKTRCL